MRYKTKWNLPVRKVPFPSNDSSAKAAIAKPKPLLSSSLCRKPK